MVPSAGLARSITARSDGARDGVRGEEVRDAGSARDAAYVLFEEEELVGRRKTKSSHDDLLGRFEKERQAVCEGTLLLS